MIGPAHELIPHRAPMQFVQALVECSETTAVATACLEEDHYAVSGGAVLEAALVECAAQTVAAAMGHRLRAGRKDTTPARGMLTSVSGFQIAFRPPAGAPLRIEVRERKRLGMMLMISCVITSDGRNVATGDLTLYA